MSRNEIQVEETKPKPSAPSLQARGGLSRSPAWGAGAGEQAEQSRSAKAVRLAQQARSRADQIMSFSYF